MPWGSEGVPLDTGSSLHIYMYICNILYNMYFKKTIPNLKIFSNSNTERHFYYLF